MGGMRPGRAGVGAAREDNRRVLVVIPAWNEERTVADVVCEVRGARPDVDVLVVDDGSWDETATVARSAGARVCRLPFNLGVGGAMRTGYRYALRHGYDVVVQVDADGQHDPAYLDAARRRARRRERGDRARFAGEGAYPARGPRRLAMVLLARVLSRLAHARLSDVTSGFRAADRRAITVFAAYYPCEYLGDTVESLVIALRNGCRVTQVPVSMRARAAGRGQPAAGARRALPGARRGRPRARAGPQVAGGPGDVGEEAR